MRNWGKNVGELGVGGVIGACVKRIFCHSGLLGKIVNLLFLFTYM